MPVPAHRSRRAFLVLPMVLPMVVAACASAEPSYYRLNALPGAPMASAGAPRLVELRRIGLASYLDRPEIIRAGGPNRLDLLPRARWAEPLATMIGRVLAENLTSRLPGTTVFSEGGALSIDSDSVAEIEIQRFEADGAQVLLLAQVVVRRGTRDRRTQAVSLQVPLGGSDAGTLVAAMSQAMAQLGDRLAAMFAAAG